MSCPSGLTKTWLVCGRGGPMSTSASGSGSSGPWAADMHGGSDAAGKKPGCQAMPREHGPKLLQLGYIQIRQHTCPR